MMTGKWEGLCIGILRGPWGLRAKVREKLKQVSQVGQKRVTTMRGACWWCVHTADPKQNLVRTWKLPKWELRALMCKWGTGWERRWTRQEARTTELTSNVLRSGSERRKSKLCEGSRDADGWSLYTREWIRSRD